MRKSPVLSFAVLPKKGIKEMPKFIELHVIPAHTRLFNANYIHSVTPQAQGSRLEFNWGGSDGLQSIGQIYHVAESYDEVKNMLIDD